MYGREVSESLGILGREIGVGMLLFLIINREDVMMTISHASTQRPPFAVRRGSARYSIVVESICVIE